MNKTFLILLYVFLSSEFIETRPRYGYRFWSKFVKSSEESSEDDSFETCVNCIQTNIGNGYKNRNKIHYNYQPSSKQNNEQTDVYQEIEEQSEKESQLVTRSTYRPTSKQEYNSFGNESPEGDENYNNQRPLRSNSKPIYENRRPYTDYNQKRTNEIGDFGNGHHNTNTFNIHKKNIYIS